jgi:urease accessory protein UreF
LDTDTLPAGGQHPYAAQLDALEGVLCVDVIAGALGTARVGTVLELSVLLERYRVTLLEPVELPAVAAAHRHAARGEVLELIALDEALAQSLDNKHPEWLQLAHASQRFGADHLKRLQPMRDERVVQRFLDAAREGRAPANHPVVFGLTMAVFSIAPRQGLGDYAQSALEAVVATAAGKLKLTQADRDQLINRSQTRLPEAIERMVA